MVLRVERAAKRRLKSARGGEPMFWWVLLGILVVFAIVAGVKLWRS
jgi:hypothetical protein